MLGYIPHLRDIGMPGHLARFDSALSFHNVRCH